MSRPRPRSAEERLLLAAAMGIDVKQVALADPSCEDIERYERLLEQHEQGVPVQHLCGQAHFRTVSLDVGPGVFIPRPETEVMVGWVIDHAPKGGRVVELCAGSGAISKALWSERPDLDIHAIEISEDAFVYAVKNLAMTPVDIVLGDMADAFPGLDNEVDVVVANPPYIPLEAWESVSVQVRDYDPHLALFSGNDGLDAMHVVARVGARLLRDGGVLAAEHAEVQSESVQDLFTQAGFFRVRDHLDLNDRPRFVTGMKMNRGKISV